MAPNDIQLLSDLTLINISGNNFYCFKN